MPAFLATFPLILAVVFVASGLGKLRHPDSLESWRDLAVPARLRKQWMLRSHPWAEIVLALTLALLGGALGVIAAATALALMGVYTLLVARALRSSSGASCACFGARAAVTRATLIRNLWLTCLAVTALSTIWATPVLGGSLVAVIASEQAVWLLPLAATATTTLLVVRSNDAGPERGVTTAADPITASAGAPSESDLEDDADYIRVRTPAVPVTLADGTTVNLRALASHKPILLLAVSEDCGACTPIIESVTRYRKLLPEVDVRFLLRQLPENSTLTSTTDPQTLHDLEGYVSGSIMDWPTPTAVLLGMDGMLAGGPETGSDVIDAFVDDIYESLHGERPTPQSVPPRASSAR